MCCEPFLDFLNPKDFLLRPMIRSETNHHQSIGYGTQNATHHKFHKHIDLKEIQVSVTCLIRYFSYDNDTLCMFVF